MLGKGLESLIPRKGDRNDGANGAGSQPVFLPVGDILSDPADELPAPPQEFAFPAEPEKEGFPDMPKEEEPIAVPVAANIQGSGIVPEEQKLPAQSQSVAPASEPVASLPSEPARDVSVFSTTSSQILAAKTWEGKPAAKPKKKEENDQESIFHIEVDKIAPNPGQPRRNFDEAGLRELASSIREFGFIQPLVVTKKETETPTGIDVSYELIAGERRLNAAKLLGLQSVPAIVRNVNLEREKLELAVIENIQREDLNPIETARAFQRLQEEFRMTQREIAAKLGKSREAVANNVRLLDLPVYIQEALQEGALSESHGRLLLAIGDPAAQKALFDDIAERRLTTRDVKERVRQITHRPPAGGTHNDLTPELRAVQDHLSSALGAPVEIHQGAANGKITITFYSEEELDNIVRRLGTD
jgi:ParB family chromosome partitioning protein